MATLKITQVVETTKEIEIQYPIYATNNRNDHFMIYVDNEIGYEVIPSINCMTESLDSLEHTLGKGGKLITKAEFNEAVQKADANFTLIYEAIQGAQVKPMVDEVQQRLDLEDAKEQEALENYLNK